MGMEPRRLYTRHRQQQMLTLTKTPRRLSTSRSWFGFCIEFLWLLDENRVSLFGFARSIG